MAKETILDVYKFIHHDGRNYLGSHDLGELYNHIKYLKYVEAMSYNAISKEEFRLLVLDDNKILSNIIKALTSENPTIKSLIDQLLIAIELDK